jgi:quinoprotein glucose dehydrogenase
MQNITTRPLTKVYAVGSPVVSPYCLGICSRRTVHGRMTVFGLLRLLCALTVCAAGLARAEVPMTTTPQPDGTKAAQAQIAGFRVPPGMKVELFAAEPQLYSPVAIGLDERGRVFVAEEFRFNRGTEENRTRPFFLEDDLQIKTLDDRLSMYRKFADKFEGGMDWFHKYTDQVRLLEDKDGDGRADKSTIFASGFNDTLDGLAAGVMARDGDVYLTNIPHLWRLRDEDGDGVAEKREKLLTGFGVNAGFLGHDLHGLVWGPDGRLYFSVGDRGFHVKTKEGTTLATPRRGAVFRCNPDGTGLEVVHIGLRNPQELAFDELGNLFADDNNCDKGDHARLVLIIPGGDSGWNMAYQTIPAPYETGPWHAEKMWYLDEPAADDVRPAFCLPPVGKLGAGPSGFAYCGATGWPEKMRGRFYMCNYTGNGGIESFAVKPKGAAYELVDQQDVFKPIQATDCEFGYDGKLYVSDFVGLEWNGGSRGGRIYTLSDPALVKSDVVKEVQKLFLEGFRHRENDELASLLKHSDMRVRQRAQFALAERGEKSIGVFISATEQKEHLLSRLHGIWGLGQVGKKSRAAAGALQALFGDGDSNVVAQAVKTLGEMNYRGDKELESNIIDELNLNLLHDSYQVRFQATIALGRLKHKPSVEYLFKVLRSDSTHDKHLRHAVIFALSEMNDPALVLSRADDEDREVRLAVLLVLRRWKDTRLVKFLADTDVAVATEAARAINDLHMDEQMPQLAALADSLTFTGASVPEPLARRILSADFRLGTEASVLALAKVAENPKLPLAIRREAVSCLADWSDPPQRDRVTGFWRPLAKRDPEKIRKWLEPRAPALFANTTGDLQTAVTKMIEKYAIESNLFEFIDWIRGEKCDLETRLAILSLLVVRKDPQAEIMLDEAIFSREAWFRARALTMLSAAFPERGLRFLESTLAGKPYNPDTQVSIVEKQAAIAALTAMKSEKADELLRKSLSGFADGSAPVELQLDLLEAAKVKESNPAIKSLAAKIDIALSQRPIFGEKSVALRGGDAERGKAIFTGHRQAQCVRCHKVGTSGGEAAPDLSHVASRDLTQLGLTKDDKGRDANLRSYLLESLLTPSAKIAPGYGTVTLLLTDGTTIGGIIKSEKDGVVNVITPDNKSLQLKAADIEQRSEPKSAMPAIQSILSLRELRDVVEYLSTLK